MIARVFAAWIDGLVAVWLALIALLHRQQRFSLRTDAKSFRLYAADQSPPELLLAVDDDREPEKIPNNVLERTRGGIIDIVVPAAAIVQRRLDALPAESLPYVEQVVVHQMETMFPWRASDILHSTHIAKRADGQLDVVVRATARPAIAPALAVAEACAAGEIRVVGEGEGDAGILAAVGSEQKDKAARVQFFARYAVIGLLALVVVVIGWTTFANWSLSSDVAALDEEIASRRAILKRFTDSTDGGQNRGLDAKKRLAPAVVVVLDQLSAVLPDNTYLTDLSLEAGHLRITGVSANAAELVPLLEGSGLFKNASFYAPTTRLAGGTTDRFSIEATVVPKPVVAQ